MKFSTIIFFTFFASAVVLASIPHSKRGRDVILHGHSISTVNEPQFHLNAKHEEIASSFPSSTKHQYLVHVAGVLNTEEKKRIEDSLGQSLGMYMPHHTYLLYATKEVAMKAQETEGVFWVGAFLPEHKVPTAFEENLKEGKNVPSQLVITLWPEAIDQATRTFQDVQSIASSWSKAVPATIAIKSFDVVSKKKIVANLASSSSATEVKKAVEWLSRRPESHWIEPKATFKPHNFYATQVIQTNAEGSFTNIPYSDSGINGSSVLVGFADTGIDFSSCYFSDTANPPTASVDSSRRKIVRYVTTSGDFQDNNGHGTHLAGTIAGASQDTGIDQNGIAYAAKLHFTDLSTNTDGTINVPTNFVDSVLQVADNDGVEIFLAAFGSDANWYSSLSADLDDYLFVADDLLFITSAGNDGQSGVFSDFALAKNVLTVGSCMSTNAGVAQAFSSGPALANVTNNPALFGTHTLSEFSGRGPTPDGRIKPDVVAPGESIKSAALGECSSSTMSGTSNAAAVVAGAAALVRDYFEKLFYPLGYADLEFNEYSSPSAALLKALIINSGESLLLAPTSGSWVATSGTVPDNNQGYGRPQLDKILYILSVTPGTNLFIAESTVASTQSFRQCFRIDEPGAFVKITLVWKDPAGSPASGLTLVNNLDLVLMSSDGREYRSQSSKDAGQFDQLNNVEQIDIIGLPTGDYAIYVHGTYVVQASTQPFSLVLSGGGFSTLPTACTQLDDSCPNDCSGAGTCTGGRCTCTSPYYGPDCSLSPCPNDCSANGICDPVSRTCECGLNFAPPDCSEVLAQTSSDDEETVVVVKTEKGVSTGVVIGAVVAAFFIGAIASIAIGGFIAYRALLKMRDKAAKDRQGSEAEMS